MTQEKLLKYVEYIAIRYYGKHYKVFEKDAVSLDDLKQEAKIICLKICKKYKKTKKNGFNQAYLPKFVNRAVGWRLGDMLRGAIVNSSTIARYEDCTPVNAPEIDVESHREDYISSDSYDRFNNVVGSDANAEFYSLLSSDLRFGFNVKDLLKHFKGKSLTILKKLLEYKSITQIQKEMNYKNHNSIRDIITNEIRPKVEEILKKQLIEIRTTTI